MQPNFASIMPQAIGVWCEQAGHEVRHICSTGAEDLEKELPDRPDLLFIAPYTMAAHLAYALSHIYRRRGTVTALGGSHARCYPHDAATYFDYVLGFTDRAILEEVLREYAPHRSQGRRLSAARQPASLPAVLPAFYTDRVREGLGPWWHALPEGALHHDPNAYLKAHEASAGAEHTVQARAGIAARRPNGP